MGREIERKFLVAGEAWRAGAVGVPIRQGYLNLAPERTVRVRTVGGRAFLAVKGKTVGATRAEFEYEIPLADGLALLADLAEKPLLEKRRYRLPWGGLIWEIDEFSGENAGLVVAEVELRDEGQPVAKPAWVGVEVTGDPRYFNASLVRHPYRTWEKP